MVVVEHVGSEGEEEASKKVLQLRYVSSACFFMLPKERWSVDYQIP